MLSKEIFPRFWELKGQIVGPCSSQCQWRWKFTAKLCPFFMEKIGNSRLLQLCRGYKRDLERQLACCIDYKVPTSSLSLWKLSKFWKSLGKGPSVFLQYCILHWMVKGQERDKIDCLGFYQIKWEVLFHVIAHSMTYCSLIFKAQVLMCSTGRVRVATESSNQSFLVSERVYSECWHLCHSQDSNTVLQ